MSDRLKVDGGVKALIQKAADDMSAGSWVGWPDKQSRLRPAASGTVVEANALIVSIEQKLEQLRVLAGDESSSRMAAELGTITGRDAKTKLRFLQFLDDSLSQVLKDVARNH